ncbi:MAG TPA: PhnD/SsuA/transferrin family substrate-binding protein [Thiobacillaceae bacterium]|nr:PhnD/SsuA/transferrin family substrate-binding protein [Thiobacillaceae bacterium]HNU64729.1 PhnD/SsuA/transferrin family substrate-binding protein [Thiobacillaceae bacterium]
MRFALVLLTLLLAGTAHAAKLPRLILAGPYASVSNPLIHMVESGALRDVADKVEFVPWKDPDQLRVLALEGRADFVAMPTNVAANLYNRGVKLNLLNVSTWGVLWMISRDPKLKTLADFKGKEIAMPFRADMPDIVFGLLAQAQGIDPRRDFRLRYVASPLDAMQLLVMRRVDHALLAEPAVSMALRKTRSFPVSLIAPELYRSVDLQKEWGRVFRTEARMPQAGIVVLGKARTDARLIERFQAEYAASLRWCQANAVACGRMVAKYVDLLTPEAVADSMAASQMRVVPARQARPELEAFFRRLHAQQPALLGGRLPDAGFYYAPPTGGGTRP